LKRMVRVLAVAVFVAAVLVIISAPAIARPKFGQPVPTAVCSVLAEEGDSGLFEWRQGGEVCWFTPPVVSNLLF
jgi:hypothetical protein